ncbi:S-adenosyl-L-methionine-dependent methyltransferase [Dendrothele bispora CBS 962.96]|uniref:S-adenosyl-L-methionine-dependent methyltransferase n=1 Tax=Dendrothele bispora (strain CBS 962.96) TaxID=1314807 RepID=A0A4S8KXQ8_DENBC|nr:S-adenosyl-L-methionine-dependent methyltransferase [Dendrothele bispora CBS 962.96]
MTDVGGARNLLSLIADSLSTLETCCARTNTSIPDLREPFTLESEAFRTADPDAARAASIISAAALQLEAIFTPPQVGLLSFVAGSSKAAALRICLESNVTEILREAGPEGMHVNEIAKINGQDPSKLARFLRYLSTCHIYVELSPDVFANNRISSLMDSHKSVENLLARPEEKYINTNGLAAFVGHHLDETFKAAAYSWETLSDPEMGKSSEPNASPFNKVHNTKETLFSFYERPDQASRRKRFGIAMQGVEKMQPPTIIPNAYAWNQLPSGSVVVDVGGGVGTACLALAEKFPHLKLVVQDLPGIIDGAHEVWSKRNPTAISSGQVELQVHNFFEQQPQKKAAVYFLKHVLHNWSDEKCINILSRLRESAGESTKLVLMESLIPYACHDAGEDYAIPSESHIEAPKPLLANFGAANEMGFILDMIMYMVLNSQERTFRGMDLLLKKSGWKIVQVKGQAFDSSFFQVEAVPL